MDLIEGRVSGVLSNPADRAIAGLEVGHIKSLC